DENSIRDYAVDRAANLATLKLVGYPEVIHALLDRFTDDASVVLFGGLAKDRPYPGSTMVSTVNGGISTLINTLALELAPLRFNAIHPAVVGDTPYWLAKPAEVLEGIRSRTPTGRLVTTEDIVHATAFLLENRGVNAINLVVDGGSLLKRGGGGHPSTAASSSSRLSGWGRSSPASTRWAISTTARLTGVAIPCRAPRRTTLPLMSSTSDLRPFIQSWRTVVLVSGRTKPSSSVSNRNSARSGAWAICSGVRPKIGSTGWPAACPTRRASSLERIMRRRISGMAAASSMGKPRIAVVTRVPELLTSFIHLAARISSVTSTVPEWRRSGATSSSRPCVLSWKLPTANHERSGGELRSTTPGSHIID